MTQIKSFHKETVGTIFILTQAVLWSLFPILANQGVKTIPPLTFAAVSTLISAIGLFLYAWFTRKLSELKIRATYFPLMMITLCIIVIPYSLFFIGTQYTSSINTSLLLLAELIFTFLFSRWLDEKITRNKIIGALAILIGASFVLYHGSLTLNTGDILIILSTITYPLGNFYSKKALKQISPASIVFVRATLGGVVLLILARLVEPTIQLTTTIASHWVIFLIEGVIVLGVVKILFHEGLKRLDVTKAISLSLTFPLFSLLILIILFGERPSFYQIIGMIIMFIGIYFTVKRNSTI